MVNIILLFVISLFSFLFHLAEVFVRGWDWLYWTKYFHISFLVAPLLFIFWLNFAWKWKLGIIRNLIFVVSYAICFSILLVSYANCFLGWLEFMRPVYSILYFIFPTSIFLYIIVFPILIPFFGNILLVKVFRLSVRWWDFIIAFFLPFAAHLIAQLVNLGMERFIPFFYYKGLDDWIFQFKTGTIIFAYMLAEGLFIELHRKKLIKKTDEKIDEENSGDKK